ncbi:ladderlectin-like [Megalobrama amblycephala]|uniref:ladderlectin-like n=1 Tax=Megalobrama amblycephala TaxID=75352 RepID=UPI0020144215|nr:ladderlectin-like [Megalobrama amblycephala]XP_048013859.1 ladderlectin-like [Megalobrama amblycephala]
MWISAAFILFALAESGVMQSDYSIGRKCLVGWEKFGTQCFKFFSEPKSWADAEKHCVELGGNLAAVHIELTNSFLKTFVKKLSNSNTRSWIGAHDAPKAFVWFWSDGSTFDYSDWHSGQPNNGANAERCVEMGYGDEKRWNDAPCENLLPFICYRVARIEF